jgi:hypothetical protein
MSVQESSATALIRFTGLGIICFNDAKQQGEIGVVRDDNHTLTVKIQKPVFQDEIDSDVIVYQDIATYENLPKDDVQIEITASNPAIKGYEIYQSGDFNRLESDDLNDFRWIVNMNALHDGAVLVKPTGGDRYPLTKLYIRNGLFYTHKLDQDMFFEKVEKDPNGVERQREAFGNIAETIGVKIEGDEVNFTIRIGGKKETHSLKRIEGLPFRIEIKNMDYSAGAVYSDMPDYYKYMSSESGVHFDLAPVIEGGGDQRVKGGAVNQDDFCHPVGGNFSSIDEL